ncbi:MAG TPA: hypothetical protein VM308_09530 [Sphingomicrobium sp.]|nr:hypothetical protein [Sphingomicrobium sp.]
MSSAPTVDDIARDATWLVQAIDPAAGVARLVAMDRESYRAASFLDDRMLEPPVDAQLVAWTEVELAASQMARQDARWIFHIGHVGSTLVSRLLGEIEGVLAVREPRLLRDLAFTPGDIRGRYLAPVPRLLSRTFAEDELACVKATSFASQIAAQLVPPGERALFMFARPERYVAGILAGENSLKELEVLAPSRAERLGQIGTDLPPPRSAAEAAAAAWAAEMVTLEHAAEAMPDRQILWQDFDAMLGGMTPALARVAGFFGFGADAQRLDEIVAGPLMRRYSKALEYEYSPALRDELLGDIAGRFGNEITAALAMVERAAEKAPLLARALSRGEPES